MIIKVYSLDFKSFVSKFLDGNNTIATSTIGKTNSIESSFTTPEPSNFTEEQDKYQYQENQGKSYLLLSIPLIWTRSKAIPHLVIMQFLFQGAGTKSKTGLRENRKMYQSYYSQAWDPCSSFIFVCFRMR